MEEVAKYPNCFVCGDKHDHGLKAKFYFDGQQVVSRVTASREFEGYRDIYHGGILSAMLDEVMIKAILARNVFAVTAEMTVRFLRPIAIGQELTFIGKVTATKGRMFLTEGEVVDAEGEPFATATAKYIKARPELEDRLRLSLTENLLLE